MTKKRRIFRAISSETVQKIQRKDRNVMMNLSSTFSVHLFLFRHWDCSILPILSMPQKMKPSVVAYRRKRRKKECQDFKKAQRQTPFCLKVSNRFPQFIIFFVILLIKTNQNEENCICHYMFVCCYIL